MNTGGSGGIPGTGTGNVKGLIKQFEQQIEKDKAGKSSGIKPVGGKSILPREPSKAAATSLSDRKAEVTPPQPSVNPDAHSITVAQRDYLEQHKVVESLQTQKDLVDNIPLLRKHLKSPDLPTHDLPFMVVFVKDGQMTQVIPPEKHSDKSKELLGDLKTQLDTIDNYYNAAVTADLNDRLTEATTKLTTYAKAIESQGGEVPVPPHNPRVIYLDLKLLTGTPAETDPATGQVTGAQPPKQPDPSKARFEMRLKEKSKETSPHPATPAPPPPLQSKHPEPPEPETGQGSANPDVKKNTDPSQMNSANPSWANFDENAPIVPIETHLQSTGAKQHADIFIRDDSVKDPWAGSIASVNAGSTTLAVGMGGINGQFAKEIQNPDKYLAFHQSVLEKCKDSTTEVVIDPDTLDVENPGLATCFVSKPQQEGHQHQGTVILDVFKDNFPHGNPLNRAMIYVIPPKGENYDTPEAFQAAIKDTAKRLYLLQNTYNLQLQRETRSDLSPLPVLRTCAFSSGIYRNGKATEGQVAAAIKSGFAAAQEDLKEIPRPNTITEIQYEDGAGKTFSGSS